MTCECCPFDPIVKAIAAITKTFQVSQNDTSSARRQSVTKEIDPIQYKINRESSKRKPKTAVIKPLKKLHPKFLQLVKLVHEIADSPDGISLSLPQQVCLACSQSSNDDNLSNSGQTFVSIDAMVSSNLSSYGDDPSATVSLSDNGNNTRSCDDDGDADPDDLQNVSQSDLADQDSPFPEGDPSQTSHDYLASHAIVSTSTNPCHSDPEPTSSLPAHIHDTLVKYLNDFRSLSTFEQMLILQQWAGGTFSDFGSMKWIPEELKRPQSKQLISQRWAKTVQKFPLAAVLQHSKSLKTLTSSANSLSAHYSDDSTFQLELPALEIPKS